MTTSIWNSALVMTERLSVRGIHVSRRLLQPAESREHNPKVKGEAETEQGGGGTEGKGGERAGAPWTPDSILGPLSFLFLKFSNSC